jgi:amidase
MRRLTFALGLVALNSIAGVAQTSAVHTFAPERYYNTFSGAHPAALRIKPGERVVTKTIDASGVDAGGKSVAQGPNPQTGPFFIEGAEPGDMIAVTFTRMETNRTTGYSSGALAPYTVTPGSILQRTERQAPRANWILDKARGTARLDNADIGGVELRMRPMLGCVGVAPARKEAIATSTPGAFGGNMDYAGLNQGVKVMLPVNEPGALLFIGDGHALQGHGEVVGTGIETSMDVEFTVQLVKKSPILWPRLENEEYVMVLGSERSLLEALQQATTEMHRWLMQDYGLTERGASVLMGQALEYEVANVVDPRFTMVAKLKKATLAGLKK